MKGVIFIVSMPRAGSTLLQRVLATHPKIYAKVSEPWLALRLFPPCDGVRTVSDLGWRVLEQSYREVVQDSHAAQQAYDLAMAGALRSFYGRLMEQAGVRADFYLDKTPRYFLILRELMRAFPQDKIILMNRNPLAVAASAIATWSKRGEWNLFSLHLDLYSGIAEICEVLAGDHASVHVLRYEDLVSSPGPELERLAAYLGLGAEFKCDELPAMAGSFGDPTGVGRYGMRISDGSLDAWAEAFAPYWRRRWALRYLGWIGRERLALMGYDLDRLRADLLSRPVVYRRMLQDPVRMAAGFLIIRAKKMCFSFIRRYE